MSTSPSDASRPRKFEEVLGQDRAVNMVKNILSSRAGWQHVLLSGPVSSGKTTLALIYARALNCLKREPSGSPCGQCTRCLEKRPDDIHEIDVPGEGDSVAVKVKQLYRPPDEAKFRVIFLDEAHALGKAADGLLKMVEEKRHNVVFVLATTEASRISDALASRVVTIELTALPKTAAYLMLRQEADKKGIDYDNDALMLLAGLSGGFPRDMLNRLALLGNMGKLTRALVADVLHVPHEEALKQYYCALADGDHKAQLAALRRWNESTSDKARWIKSFLLKLYYHSIKRRFDVNPLIDSIPADAFRSVLERFRARDIVLDRQSFMELLDLWSDSEEQDAEALQLRLAMFHHKINHRLLGSGKTSADAHSLELEQPLALGSDGFDPPPILPPEVLANKPQEPEQDPHFLSRNDARSVVNRASFLIQHYNRMFNARVTLDQTLSPDLSQSQLIAQANTFLIELGEFLKPGPVREWFWMMVPKLERQGLQVRIMLSLPSADDGDGGPGHDAVAKWALNWASSRERAGTILDYKASPQTEAKALKFHWDGAIGLLDGLSEYILDWDPQGGQWLPLRKLLRVPAAEYASKFVHSPLVQVSRLLTDREMGLACQSAMRALSAFDARAWGWLRSGWERDEFTEREKEIAIRTRKLEEFRLRSDGDKLDAAALAELESWNIPAQARNRGWRGWWSEEL